MLLLLVLLLLQHVFECDEFGGGDTLAIQAAAGVVVASNQSSSGAAALWLVADPSVQCYSLTHWPWMVLALVVLLLYIAVSKLAPVSLTRSLARSCAGCGRYIRPLPVIIVWFDGTSAGCASLLKKCTLVRVRVVVARARKERHLVP